MKLVHRGFRREFHNTADLVRGVSRGDVQRAAVVGEHIEFMMTVLHHHRLAEDGVVWPRLSARGPSRAAEIKRMEDAHRAIDETGDRLRSTVVQWAQTGDSWLAGQLLPLIEDFSRRIDEHFDDEESKVVPLIAEYLSPKEWRKFLAHGSAFVRAHPRRGLALGAIVLDGEPVESKERFLGNVPLFARAAYKMFGERVYAGYRTQVYGSA
jgi:hemerythrin-like domain-containing protein